MSNSLLAWLLIAGHLNLFGVYALFMRRDGWD